MCSAEDGRNASGEEQRVRHLGRLLLRWICARDMRAGRQSTRLAERVSTRTDDDGGPATDDVGRANRRPMALAIAPGPDQPRAMAPEAFVSWLATVALLLLNGLWLIGVFDRWKGPVTPRPPAPRRGRPVGLDLARFTWVER